MTGSPFVFLAVVGGLLAIHVLLGLYDRGGR